MIFFGTIDFGLAFNASLTISNAAREGARTGSRPPDRSRHGPGHERRRHVERQPTDHLRLMSDAEHAACAGGHERSFTGDTLVVTVGYNYSLITPIAFGTRIPLSVDSRDAHRGSR